MQQKLRYSAKIAYPTILLFGCAWIVLIISSYVGIKESIHPAWSVVCNALMIYILFTPMHEAGHQNISGGIKKASVVDEVIGWLSGLPLLAPFYVFKIIHFRHHAFTNDPERDPDHWLASKNIFSLFFHSATIFPLYITESIRLLTSKKVSKSVKKELSLGFVGLAVILTLLVTYAMGFGMMNLLLFWLLPALLAQILLAFAFDWLPHHPHEEKGKYKNTRVFNLSGLNILLLAQNFHLIHHLQPRIPFYEYKKYYLKLEDELKKEGIQVIE